MTIRVPQISRTFEVSRGAIHPFTPAERDDELRKLRGHTAFMDHQRGTDGPPSADRLVRETLGSFGLSWRNDATAVEAVIWIQLGADPTSFAFVVADPSGAREPKGAECGAGELTGTIMAAISSFFSPQSSAGTADLISRATRCNREIFGALVANHPDLGGSSFLVAAESSKPLRELKEIVSQMGTSKDSKYVKTIADALADSAPGATLGVGAQFELQCACILALKKIGEPSLPWIEEGQRHSNPEVREAFRKALREVRPTGLRALFRRKP